MTLTVMLARWVGLEVFALGPMANASVTTVNLTQAGSPHLRSWADDPGNQGVTFPAHDWTEALVGTTPVPVDLSHPEGL